MPLGGSDTWAADLADQVWLYRDRAGGPALLLAASTRLAVAYLAYLAVPIGLELGLKLGLALG